MQMNMLFLCVINYSLPQSFPIMVLEYPCTAQFGCHLNNTLDFSSLIVAPRHETSASDRETSKMCSAADLQDRD